MPLELQMMKLRLSYFGHTVRSLEKDITIGKIEGSRCRERLSKEIDAIATTTGPKSESFLIL